MIPEYDHTSTSVPADAETARPACKPWCVQHDPDGDVCASNTIDVPGYSKASLTYTEVEGLRIHMDYASLSTAETWQLTKAILALLDLDNPPPAQSAEEEPDMEPVPDVVQAQALAAGREAMNNHLLLRMSELSTHDLERQAIKNGTLPRPTWLDDDPCPSWCAYGHEHLPSSGTGDRTHGSAAHRVTLNVMEPIVIGYPKSFAQPTLCAELSQHFREKEARVIVHVSDQQIFEATLAEAEQIARNLLDLVAQARGRSSQPCLDVPCPDVACRICYPLPSPVGSST
ncbi:DUF6907 domain-containing protein [Nonomuraea sp. NPDC050663]|uniref:DUF6907 domain-containing protein n=1 Tax=Nonomuraea sp. NPDC050663 TaxID=3364370 RepID=UPI00378D2032